MSDLIEKPYFRSIGDDIEIRASLSDMMQHEPDWVMSRYKFMESRIAELGAEIAALTDHAQQRRETITALTDKLERAEKLASCYKSGLETLAAYKKTSPAMSGLAQQWLDSALTDLQEKE